MNYSNEQAFHSSGRNSLLTPSERLAVIEQAESLKRQRRKATAKVFGVVFLMFASCILCMAGFAEVVFALFLLGAFYATAAIWGAFNLSTPRTGSASKSEIDPEFLHNLDQRLANLEMIVGYEEKIAARNRQAEGAQD